jgi:hypothetical protein
MLVCSDFTSNGIFGETLTGGMSLVWYRGKSRLRDSTPKHLRGCLAMTG